MAEPSKPKEPTPDAEVTLDDERMQVQPQQETLYKTYTPYALLKIWCKTKTWQLIETFVQNSKAAAAEMQYISKMEAFNSDKCQMAYTSLACVNKVHGRHVCAVDILKLMFGNDMKWLELVDNTKQMVLDERDRRGAMDKPVLKKKDEYLK